MPRVFLSHSSRDRRFVEQELVPLLRAHGIEYWYSTEHIQTAQQWRAAIYSGLAGSDYFAVVLSPAARASAWVVHEVSWALENRPGRIVPIVLEAGPKVDQLAALSAIQHVDYGSSTRTRPATAEAQR